MVQVIHRSPQQNKRSFGQEVIGTMDRAAQQYTQHQEKQAISKLLGEDAANLPNDFQKMAYESKLRGEESQKKFSQEMKFDEEEYNTVRTAFGDEFADIWKSSPVGGRTKLITAAIEAAQRGENINDVLQGVPRPNKKLTNETEEPGLEKTSKSEEPADFDKGKTPQERFRSEEARYKSNLPLFNENNEKRRSLEDQETELGILEELNPQMTWSDRLIINPFSGELTIPGLASPEAQRYVKTINDFTTKAKDSYGARVTNFDLQQFLKRLPTLANSEEGRKQITEQMRLINDINLAYQNTLQDVIDDHGGIRRIDWDKAQRIAEKKSKEKIKDLQLKFKDIGNKSNKSYESAIDERRKMAPKGTVAVERADGTQGYIPKDNLDSFLKSSSGNKAL